MALDTAHPASEIIVNAYFIVIADGLFHAIWRQSPSDNHASLLSPFGKFRNF